MTEVPSTTTAFLESIYHMIQGYPEKKARIREQIDALPPKGSPEEEEAQRLPLVEMATGRWGPAALRAAGWEDLAIRLEEAQGPEETEKAVYQVSEAIPMYKDIGPYNLDDHAIQAMHGVHDACTDRQRTPSAAARAVIAACEAVRMARQARPELESLDVVEEALSAARMAQERASGAVNKTYEGK